MTKLNLISVLSLLLLISCGSDDTSSSGDQAAVKQSSYTNTYFKLSTLDQDCTGFRGESAIFNLNSFHYSDLKKRAMSFSQDSFSFNSQLDYQTNNIIESVETGAHIQLEYFLELDENGIVIEKEYLDGRYIYESSPLTICSLDIYKSTDLEGAAISIMWPIYKSNQILNSAFNSVKSTSISPVKVETQYIEESIYYYYATEEDSEIAVESKNYFVNNAIYAPKNKRIAFTPSSTSSEKHLWQSPWVAVHEYGHHIFYDLMSEYRYDILNSNANHRHKCSHDNRYNTFEDSKSYYGEDGVKTFLKALNEAFSDLSAKYSLSEDESSTLFLPCNALTREPSHDRFLYSEQKKVLTYQIWSNYQDQAGDMPDNCWSFNVNDPHHIGAIFAHIIWETLNIDSLENQNEEKLRIIFSWLKNLNDNYADDKGRSGFLYMSSSFKKFFDMIEELGLRSESETSALKNKFFGWMVD